ncbi:MAG: hypothetical protein NC489_14170 [Ruminococcus flavefaciens]|nr:hypothetical protein [Ruminococcus flavefaciens]
MESTVVEHKNKVGGDALGEAVAAKTSRLGSPGDGVPILEGDGKPRQMIRQMEKVLGISSWIDNI